MIDVEGRTLREKHGRGQHANATATAARSNLTYGDHGVIPKVGTIEVTYAHAGKRRVELEPAKEVEHRGKKCAIGNPAAMESPAEPSPYRPGLRRVDGPVSKVYEPKQRPQPMGNLTSVQRAALRVAHACDTDPAIRANAEVNRALTRDNVLEAARAVERAEQTAQRAQYSRQVQQRRDAAAERIRAARPKTADGVVISAISAPFAHVSKGSVVETAAGEKIHVPPADVQTRPAKRFYPDTTTSALQREQREGPSSSPATARPHGIRRSAVGGGNVSDPPFDVYTRGDPHYPEPPVPGLRGHATHAKRHVPFYVDPGDFDELLHQRAVARITATHASEFHNPRSMPDFVLGDVPPPPPPKIHMSPKRHETHFTSGGAALPPQEARPKSALATTARYARNPDMYKNTSPW